MIVVLYLVIIIGNIWFIVNECPAITTDKKLEFRNYLMARGLRLLGKDKNIIDNFSK